MEWEVLNYINPHSKLSRAPLIFPNFPNALLLDDALQVGALGEDDASDDALSEDGDLALADDLVYDFVARICSFRLLD